MSGIRTGSFAPCRAGGFAGNHLIHSSFIPAKSVSSRRMTVALTTRSREVPAASRMAETFFKHCLVCSWTVFPTIFPVTGSCGPVPDTNTRPADRTAWLYVGGGAGALGVRIISLAIKFLHRNWKSHFGNFNITDQVYGRHLSHLPQMGICKRVFGGSPKRSSTSDKSSEVCSGRSGRIRNEKRPRVYECYWAHFAAEIHLSE